MTDDEARKIFSKKFHQDAIECMTSTPPTKQTFDDNGNSTRDVVFDGPTHSFNPKTTTPTQNSIPASPALAELMEEFDATPIISAHIFDTYNHEQKKHFFEQMQDVKSFLAKVYTTARRQALTEGIAALGEWECICLEGQKHNLVCWKGQEYRAEAIAKLTQLRDV